MKTGKVFAILAMLSVLLLTADPVAADGFIIPTPPAPCQGRTCPPPRPIMEQLAVKYHHVSVTIDQRLAVTHVDQTFYNPNDYPVEGIYTFPLPADASLSAFSMWVDGRQTEGKLLDAQQARQTYNQIVQQMRDPALLEYVGRGAFQASIFPIPPHETRRIELEYSQVLTADNNLVKYVYPLNTEKFSSLPLESVSVTVKVKDGQPIRAVYSPSHAVNVTRDGDKAFIASYEDNNVTPDSDFALYYSVGQDEAFHLLTYRDPADPADKDGFFLLLLAPKPGLDVKPVAKDVILVLDQSGSMEGEKFQQAQSAAKYILMHLNTDDRFFLMSFSTTPQVYRSELSPAGDAANAAAWVDGLSAEGSTDLNRALLEAQSVVSAERPTYMIFLTDGLPTEGELDSQKILNNFRQGARDNLRLFSFGVGYDVDTVLLDSLSGENHGLSTYVKPGDSLDEALTGFYKRISTPVLTGITLDFGGMQTYDIYPNPLPDLFEGSQVVITGRYKGGGKADVVLGGSVNGTQVQYRYPQQVFTTDSRTQTGSITSLPRLWATRKIGSLLNQERIYGANQERIDQIVKLSIRYGIVTPYTSYLVTEPQPLGADAQERLAQDTFNKTMAMPTQSGSGMQAVQNSSAQGQMAATEAPAAVPEELRQTLKQSGTRTFILTNGVWTDTSYDPQSMQTIKVAFLSDDYFKLAGSRTDIAEALAVGDQVIVVVDGKAYQVVTDGSQTGGTIVLPTVVADTPVAGITPEPSKMATPVVTGGTAPAGGNHDTGYYLFAGVLVIASLGVVGWGLFRKK